MLSYCQSPFVGLKLKLQDQPHPSVCYNYALSPFVDKPVLIDWKIFVNDDIQSQHIRCHALQPGDKVKDLISSFRRALAKAVVLINTQDKYTLGPEFTKGVARGNYPIIILTKSDGSLLMDKLEEDDGQTEVLARLDVEDSAVELQQQQQWSTPMTTEKHGIFAKSVTVTKKYGILTMSARKPEVSTKGLISPIQLKQTSDSLGTPYRLHRLQIFCAHG